MSNDRAPRRTMLSSVLWYLVPLAVFLSIWVPDFAYYHVPGIKITDGTIAKSRVEPEARVLTELERMQLGADPSMDRNELIGTAEALIAGELRLRPYPMRRFDVGFDERDLLDPNGALPFASLAVPNILMDAYARTGREEFFAAAKRFLLGFARFEIAARRPKGMLWNDHAVAARVPVIVKFWRAYRERADFDPGEAGTILQLLARSGQFLAKPTHFTYRTNHGVMQNIGLLQLCLGFPGLPDAASWCDVAMKRLHEQMRFYVDQEGVVLEHSAGYHAFGMELMGMVFRTLTLLNRPIPRDWAEKYQKVKTYYGMLRRPDGTLPMYGDTPSTASRPMVTEPVRDGGYSPLYASNDWRPGASFGLFPVAGHAIWWQQLDSWPQPRGLSQTVVTWSDFPSQAHKLPDETNIVFWRDGGTWLTNSGYWPSGTRGRSHSRSWDDSNAPHLVDERANSPRRTQLLGYADGSEATLLDLRRYGRDGYTVRRQIIQLRSGALFVFDHVEDRIDRKSKTVWTLDPRVQFSGLGTANAYRLVSHDTGSVMSLFFLGSEGTTVATHFGSHSPLSGWVVIEGVPRPAAAFTVEQPSRNSWSLLVLLPEVAGGLRAAVHTPGVLHWHDSDAWTVNVPGPNQTTTIERSGLRLLVRSSDRSDTAAMAIMQAPAASEPRAVIESSYKEVQSGSKKMRELSSYRLNVTYLLLGILAIQEIVFALLRRVARGSLVAARLAASAAWVAGCIWIQFWYLAT